MQPHIDKTLHFILAFANPKKEDVFQIPTWDKNSF